MGEIVLYLTFALSGSAFKDNILVNAIRAAENTGRVLSVMYDISGAAEDKWAATVLSDWQYLVAAHNVTASPAWLHHDDKPVLSIWGLGFVAHPGTPATSLAVVQELKKTVTFVGGVPTHWRDGNGDSKPGYTAVYEAMDVLSPWLVGRYGDDTGFDSNMKSTFIPDKQATDKLGQGYAPVVFPGFSWANLMRTTGQPPSPFNMIPRRAGKFWSYQAHGFASVSACWLCYWQSSAPSRLPVPVRLPSRYYNPFLVFSSLCITPLTGRCCGNIFFGVTAHGPDGIKAAVPLRGNVR